MTPGQLVVPLCAGGLGVAALWVWVFLDGRRRRAAWRTSPQPARPAQAATAPSGGPIDPDYALRVVAVAYHRWQQIEAEQAAATGRR